MSKNIRMERWISIILVIISVFSLILYANTMIVDAGKNDALRDGKELYGSGQTCVCAPKYTTVRPNSKTDGSVGASTIEYSLSSSASNTCVYNNPSAGTITLNCSALNADTVMRKYINADVMTKEEASRFYNDAYMYASYVQQNLASKSQASIAVGIGNFKTNVTVGKNFSDLGNGRFQRAMFEFNNNAHFVYSFLIGFAFITALLVFILIFMKITCLPDHPMQRRKAMEDIVTSGVSVILTGGIWVVISLFQSIFDRFWSSYAVYSKDWKTVGNMFLYEYKGLVVGILGLAALTVLLMLIKNFVGLSFSGDNPSARKQKMISILFCGIATAGLGALTIFTGFFWNMLN